MTPPLDPRAAELIATLGLAPHPEGGHYRELFRSAARVARADGVDRDALTAIYFLLPAGAHSRWHRVEADEAWHWQEGAPLSLWWITPDLGTLHALRLGPVDGDQRPTAVIPAGCWQAARSTGAFTLAACTVGPGFDFADFALLDDRPDEAAALRARHPLVVELG